LRISLPSDPAGDAPAAQVAGVVDHLFRREAGRLVAILARRFGAEHLHLAEDVVQDALVQAMQTWPFTGVPQNPTAWILRVARNRAIDHTRRVRLGRGKEPEFAPLVEDCLAAAVEGPAPRFEDEIRDSQLRMIFVCCHPGLPRNAQVALTLKVLCGFGEREIAAAFLTSEAAIAKRLVRARKFLREQQVAVELPPAADLAPRLEAVREVLYLLFSEGYRASHGDSLLREDLCADAIRLAELLVLHPVGDHPATRALLALMYFNAARFPARLGADGGLLRLADQERGRWDRAKIRHGFAHLTASGAGDEVSRFHLEAGIAACHALAPSEEATDWARVVELYDELLARDASPIVALNRAVAVAKLRGPHEGLRLLAAMPGRKTLEPYALFHAVAGQLWLDAGQPAQAVPCLRRALELVALEAERAHLGRLLAEAGGAPDPGEN
jgi:RNA polymerase sigma-70 factor (ECF subfamily)